MCFQMAPQILGLKKVEQTWTRFCIFYKMLFSPMCFQILCLKKWNKRDQGFGLKKKTFRRYVFSNSLLEKVERMWSRFCIFFKKIYMYVFSNVSSNFLLQKNGTNVIKVLDFLKKTFLCYVFSNSLSEKSGTNMIKVLDFL